MAFDPISAVLGVGEKLIERLIPDPQQKAEALLKLEQMKQSGDLAIIAGQNDINKLEASSGSTFVSGWRPSVGWVCSAALAFQLVIGPVLSWISQIAGHPVQPPVLNTELLTTLLVGMLGLGGMRTVEKLQGVAK